MAAESETLNGRNSRENSGANSGVNSLIHNNVSSAYNDPFFISSSDQTI